MSTSVSHDDHLMVSFVGERIAIDAIAKLLPEDPAPGLEVTLFPFDGDWADTPVAPIGYSIPPALPV